MDTSVSRRCLQPKKCADVGTKPVSASVPQPHCKVLQDWYSTDHGSHTPLQDGGSRPDDDPVREPVMELQHRNRHLSTLVGSIETDVQS